MILTEARLQKKQKGQKNKDIDPTPNQDNLFCHSLENGAFLSDRRS